jgi:hypothetical protein
MEKKTSLFDNGLIWFGAGVSVEDIIKATEADLIIEGEIPEMKID